MKNSGVGPDAATGATQTVPTPKPLWDINVALGIAMIAEFAIALLNSLAMMPFSAAMMLHVAITLFLGTFIFMRGSNLKFSDISVRAFAWLLIAVSGPAGALAILLAAPFRPGANRRPELLQSWYDRLAGAAGVDASTYLHDQVVAGRAMRFEAGTPDDFVRTITSGTLVKRQSVLGLIARKFHPDYAPALLLALRSEEPVVRVQAAAVVARVRADLKVNIKQLLEKVGSSTESLSVSDAVALNALAKCPLVDRADAQVCLESSERLLTRLLPVGTAADKTKSLLSDDTSALTAERYLISKNRYKDFRIVRRMRDIEARGHYKIRFLRAGYVAQ